MQQKTAEYTRWKVNIPDTPEFDSLKKEYSVTDICTMVALVAFRSNPVRVTYFSNYEEETHKLIRRAFSFFGVLSPWIGGFLAYFISDIVWKWQINILIPIVLIIVILAFSIKLMIMCIIKADEMLDEDVFAPEYQKLYKTVKRTDAKEFYGD